MSVPRPRTDQDLLAEIARNIRWDPRIDQAPIEVRIRDGVVTLSGTVESAGRKFAAYEDALRVQGVRQVIDNIEVHKAPRPAEPRP